MEILNRQNLKNSSLTGYFSSGSDGRRSRDLSIFSRLELLDAEPKARQFPVIMRAIDACVIQEISTDSLQL
jgi:hypothetical protein